jgi:hypothetical protein
MWATAALLAAVACSSDPVSGPGAPASLAVVSGGTNASGRVILESADRFDTVVVRVTDAQGLPVPDVAVTWTTDEPDAVVTPMAAASDAEGLVRAEWRLSGAPGTWKARATTGTLAAAEASFTVTSWSVKHAVLVGPYTCVQSHDDRLWCRESETAPFAAHLGGGTIQALDGTEGSSAIHRRMCVVTGAGVVLCATAAGGALVFAEVPGQDRPFTRIVLGTDRTDCALGNDGSLHCWGSSAGGLLGDGTPAGSFRAEMSPVSIPDGISFIDAALGSEVACAVSQDGTPWCWGRGTYGVAGSPNTGTVATPRAVDVPSPLTSIIIPDLGEAACGLDTSGRAICWGAGHGLGFGVAGGPPAPLTGASGLRQILPLQFGFMAVTTDGGLKGWGYVTLSFQDFPGSAVVDLPLVNAIRTERASRARMASGTGCLDAVGGLGTVCAEVMGFALNGKGPFPELLWTGFVKPAGAN